MTIIFTISIILLFAGAEFMARGGGYQFLDDDDGEEIETEDGFLYRVLYSPMRELKMRGLFSIRDHVFTGLFIVPILTYVFFLFYFSGENHFIASLLVGVGWTLGGLSGWGAYFDMGSSTNNRSQSKWIDAILLKIFKVQNPVKWIDRLKRDWIGFSLRLSHYLGAFLMPALYLWHIDSMSLLFAICYGIIATVLFAVLVPAIYAFTSNNYEINAWLNNNPNWPNATNVAELTKGGLFAVLLLGLAI